MHGNATEWHRQVAAAAADEGEGPNSLCRQSIRHRKGLSVSSVCALSSDFVIAGRKLEFTAATTPTHCVFVARRVMSDSSPAEEQGTI